MKKLISIVLVLAMMLLMVACTANTNKEDTNEILIGCYMPLTGPNAGSGICAVQGIEMAFEEINAAGGIDGKTLKLITYDSTGTTEGAAKAATRLIEQDGVKVIAGSFLSSSVLAVSSLTERAKVLHVGTGTGATWTNIGLDYTYRATANGNLPVATMMEQLVDCGKTSIALISVASEYGQSGHDAIIADCGKHNVEVKADIIYQSAETDYTGVISKALSAEADTIVVYGLGGELALLSKQLRQNGYDDLIFTIEGGANSEMFTVAGDASNGVVFSAAYVIPATPEEGATAQIQDILTRYMQKFNEMPYSDCFYRGYDQGRLIAEALKNCEDVNDGESIMTAFRALSGIELLGGSFDYTNATGDGLSSANKWMIMDGKIAVYNKDTLLSWSK